jgi:predicted NBD/HSP70 family sugar kinase
MPTGSGSSLESLRELNRLRVVDALRLQGHLSRADIARQTGLSRSTVSGLVAGLVTSGFVVERPEPATTASGQGRPPVLLTLDPSAGIVVGVDFDHERLRVAVSDLSRVVLAESAEDVDVDNDAHPALAAAARLVEQALADADVSRDRVLGVGVAMACPVEQNNGVLHPASILPGWEGIDPVSELSSRLGLPVHLDNDANLGALAEVTLGAGRRARAAIYLQLGTGIGAGLIVDGRLFHGGAGTAGEVGHVVVDDNGPLCRCGNRGCLETMVSGPALTGLLRDSRGADLSVSEMIALAHGGDLGCRRVIADAGQTVGRVLGALCNVFNPEIIVIGGDLSPAGELLLAPLRESVMRSALPMATRNLEVVAGELGERANVLGALALAISQSEHAVAARIAAVGAGR